MEEFSLTRIQAIHLRMQLRRLTGLEREKRGMISRRPVEIEYHLRF